MSDLPSWVKVGAKCVALYNFPGTPGAKALSINSILTIRDWAYSPEYGMWCLMFFEIYNEPVNTREGFLERGYALFAFKPLTTKTIEDDMEIFASLLNVTRIEESV